MCTVSHVGICEECVSMDANLRFLHSLGSVFLQVVSSSDSMFDSYMGFFVGAAFLYSVSHVKCFASCAFFLKLHIRAHTGAYRPLFKRRHTTCTRITSSYKPWRRASLPYHPLRFTRWQPCKALLALIGCLCRALLTHLVQPGLASIPLLDCHTTSLKLAPCVPRLL